MTSRRSAVRVSYIPMRSDWKLAAELFAASFLEICPEVIFSDIWVGHLGFYVDYSISFPLTDEYLKLIEERMREKIRDQPFCGVFEMSTRNIIECLKEMKQFRLARDLDRSRTARNVLKIGEYLGVLEEEIDPDLKQLGAIGLERRGNTIYGMAFKTKDELKQYRKALKEGEKRDHLLIGKEEGLFEIDNEEVYWFPKGVEFRKRLEREIEKFLYANSYQEVEFSGNIDWYKSKGLTKIFTTLEEEEESRFECGLKDHSLQKIFYVANSSLQMFEDFGKIISLIFEFQEATIICKDFYGTFWDVIWQEDDGVKISIDRLAAMLVEKRDFLVC